MQLEAIVKGFMAAVPKSFESVPDECQGTAQVRAEVSRGSLSSVVAKSVAREGQVGSHAGLIYTTLQSLAMARCAKT